MSLALFREFTRPGFFCKLADGLNVLHALLRASTSQSSSAPSCSRFRCRPPHTTSHCTGLTICGGIKWPVLLRAGMWRARLLKAAHTGVADHWCPLTAE
eukprot:6187403-Pleurochrysis_carterae.AAC.1